MEFAATLAQFIKLSPDGILITGATTHPVYVPVQFSELDAGVAIRLRPMQLFDALGIPASEITNGILNAEDVLARNEIEKMRRLLMNAASVRSGVPGSIAGDLFADRKERSTAQKERERALIIALRAGVIRGESDEELADSAGYSSRQLRRVFLKWTGVPPRMYRRLARFERLMVYVQRYRFRQTFSWATTALILGYSDQSHMIREFREFAGRSPEKFMQMSESFHTD